MSPEKEAVAKAERIAEMRHDLKISARAEQFIKSDFWLETLEPMLVKDQEQAKMAAVWSPGASGELSVEKIALRVVYCSGESAAIEKFVQRIRDMITRGEEAARTLERMESK